MKSFMAAASAVALMAASAYNIVDDGVSEEMRDVSAFDEVSLYGSMDVEVSVGSERSVKVIADTKYIDDVETYVDNGRLKIKLKDHRGSYYRNIKKMQVIVTVPELNAASLHGSGDMNIENVKADRFEFDLKGSGDANLNDFEVVSMELDLAGSGDIRSGGSCQDFDVNLRGSGDISARDFKCQSVDVNLRGSGDVRVFASNSADLNVQGSGDIDVYGNPDKFSSSVRGSGDINRR